MRLSLKRLEDQVLVITGATSGIGLATARLAAERGAAVMLTARDTGGLARLAKEIRSRGGRAAFLAADVGDLDEVQAVADAAVRELGGVDTWVNNAGVTIYGRIEDVPTDDARRLFDTNYWGVVHGCRAALSHMRERGGAIINIGSTLSERAIPLQGHYSASKHAVKGFTDTLRMELEKDDVPVAVTLVKPGAIDTPYPEHGRNYMDVEPVHPPPVYEPRVVARTILACAERPVRDVFVGAGGKMTAAMDRLGPVADRLMGATMFDQQQTDRPSPADRPDALYESQPGRERGSYPGHVMRTSAYTTATMHPVATLVGALAIGAGIATLARGRGPNDHE